jgi:hypothetical protein
MERGRLVTDRLRFEVASEPGPQVLVFVDDVEMTAAGAGMGMEPFELFVPDNRLVATAEARTVPIAKCTCGVYGCGATDVVIRRDGDVVHWDWEIEKPMHRGVTFPATVYDAEVARLAADHSWETPVHRAGRLVLEGADRTALAVHGLALSWAANNHRDPRRFQLSMIDGSRYQVFVDVPWDGRPPDEVAAAALAELDRPPETWTAQWHSIRPGVTEPPSYAGPGWTRFPM